MKQLSIALCLAAALNAHAATTAPRTERLGKLCKVWGAIRYLHPWVWTRDLDWDAALLHALPRARAAGSDDEFAGVVSDMLGELHDPATRVAASVAGDRVAPSPNAPFISHPKSDTLLVRIAAKHTSKELSDAVTAEREAKSVILDLRLANDSGSGYRLSRDAQQLLFGLITHPLRVPPSRSIVHRGYNAQNNVSTDDNGTLIEEESVALIPAKPGAVRRPLVVVVNEVLGVPREALALQASGEAAIIVQGATFDDLTVGATLTAIDSARVVRIRHAELIPVGATPRAQAELPAVATDKQVIGAALATLAQRSSHAAGKATASPLPPLVWRPDNAYTNEHAPSVELRLLALFRMWNVIDRFYPYKASLDDPWDDMLTRYIPIFEAADGADAYAEAVAELATHIADTHVRVRGGGHPALSAQAMAPFLTQMIEGQPVVVAVDKSDEMRASGLHVGDIIVSVGGESIAMRMRQLRRFVAASNDAARESKTLSAALAGADGSTLTMTVRDAAGKTRDVSLVRHTAPSRTLDWRSGEVVRVLDGNIGYVDLDRLDGSEVDAMFDKLKDTRAIVFDMRGYPKGTAWTIAPRLNVRGAKRAAVFERCVVRFEDEGTEPERTKFYQLLPLKADDKPIYRGKTLMLVDERTVSQAEHTGLFFEAAAGTKIVGSTTAGANGGITAMVLPGGLSVQFTGIEVRHADGRQLQRVGLPIDVVVRPTLQGIRAGRDEVLERALVTCRRRSAD